MSGQPIAILKREKRYDVLAKIDITISITGAILVCVLAIFGLGVWALIWRGAFEAIVRTGLLVKVSEMKLKIASFSEILKYKESIKFACQIVASRIPNRIVLTIDKIIIGKYFGTEALGFYTRASQPAQMIDTNLGKPISSPALSYLARMEGRVEARHYISLLWSTYLVAGFGCLIFILFGDELLPLIMGPNWVPAGKLLQYLGIWGIGKIFHSLAASYHINERKINRWTQFMILSIAVVFIIPLIGALNERSLEYFTLTFSLSYTIYWIFVYFFSIYKDYSQSWSVLFEAFFKLIIISTLTIYIQILCEEFFLNEQFAISNSQLLLVFRMLLAGLIFMSLFLILANKEKQTLLKILFRK